MARRSRPVDKLQAGLWRTYVHIGVVAYALGSLVVLGYLLATPHGRHRAAIIAIVVASLVASFGIFWRVGLRLVPTRWRTPFFAVWTVSTLAFVAAGATLDGGTQSPFSYMLVLPLLFAGMAYPPRTVATLTVVGVLAAVPMGLASPTSDDSGTAMLATVMLVAGMLATSMARSRDRLTDALLDAATHDGLTGCLTRRAFYDRLVHEEARSRRYGRPFSVILADLDQLKDLNDQGGHETGDGALLVLAQALVGAARGSDLVGRLGGDEFALLLPEAGPEEACGVAQRCLAAVRGAPSPVAVTASLGVASWGGASDRADAVLGRADRALYAAKRSGRNGFRLAPTPGAEPPPGAELTDGVRRATEETGQA